MKEKSLGKSQNETSVLISTHNLGELEQVCDHIGIINKGRILLENNLDDMKENVKKIQAAFKNDIPDELINHEDILKIEKQGRVYYIIVNNHMHKILSIINNYKPLFKKDWKMVGWLSYIVTVILFLYFL